jgi:hypothetical protein
LGPGAISWLPRIHPQVIIGREWRLFELQGTSNNSDFVIGLTIATARRPFSLLS